MLLTPLSLEQKRFQNRRNEERDGAEVTLGCNTFHARAPATRNAQSPTQSRSACGRNHDIGTGGRTQSLVRLSLGHELEILREIFRVESRDHADSDTPGCRVWSSCALAQTDKTTGPRDLNTASSLNNAALIWTKKLIYNLHKYITVYHGGADWWIWKTVTRELKI